MCQVEKNYPDRKTPGQSAFNHQKKQSEGNKVLSYPEPYLIS